jgi:hypothetical protein
MHLLPRHTGMTSQRFNNGTFIEKRQDTNMGDGQVSFRRSARDVAGLKSKPEVHAIRRPQVTVIIYANITLATTAIWLVTSLNGHESGIHH